MYFPLQAADVATLRIAASLARKAGEAAAKACERAELTQGEGEAQSLAGYADEATFRLDKMTDGIAEFGRNHVAALGTGLRLMLAKLEKNQEADTELLVEVHAHQLRRDEITRVLWKIRANPQRDLEEEVQITLEVPGQEPVKASASEMQAALDELKTEKSRRGRRSSVREAFAAAGAEDLDG